METSVRYSNLMETSVRYSNLMETSVRYSNLMETSVRYSNLMEVLVLPDYALCDCGEFCDFEVNLLHTNIALF